MKWLIDALTTVPDGAAAEALLDRITSHSDVRILSFLNANALNLAWTDKRFAEHLRASDHLLRDGIGIHLLLRLFARPPGFNANGTDMIPRLIARYENRRVALCGTATPYLEKAAAIVRGQGVPVALTMDGFQSDDDYITALSNIRADLIILAMGMPRQEHIAVMLKQELSHPCLIVNGGAVLDFMAHRVPRAPRWMRSIGIEWVYRLLKEPRRLWRRYLIGNFAFILRALAMRTGFAGRPAEATERRE